MARTFERIPIVETALHYLKRFDRYVHLLSMQSSHCTYILAPAQYCYPSYICRLRLPCLDIAGCFETILGMFMRDLEFVQKMYNKNKENPPLPRDMPPVSGRIAWVKQLYRRISSPIEVSGCVMP